MNRVLMSVLVCVGLVFGLENWNGWGDTSLVYGVSGTSTGRSKVYEHASYDDLSLYVFFNDTTSTGYAGDSSAFLYGVELGGLVLDTGGTVDTFWMPVLWVDSVNYGSEGDMTAGYADQTLAVTKSQGWVDTLNVAGWAYTGSQVKPDGGPPFIRAVVKGTTDNCGSALRVMVQFVQKLGSSVTTR